MFSFVSEVIFIIIIHDSLIHLFICSFTKPPSFFTSERPYFVDKMEPVEVIMGEALTLRCHITGTPDIAVFWFKADGKLRKSNMCSMDFANGVATLKLMETTTTDRGKYTCKAENRVGSASISCNVMVKGDFCFPHFFFLL